MAVGAERSRGSGRAACLGIIGVACLALACGEPAEPPGTLQTWALRSAAVQFTCGGGSTSLRVARSAEGKEQYALTQRKAGRCARRFELPRRSRLSFDLATAASARAHPERRARVRILSGETSGSAVLFEEFVDSASPARRHEIQLPVGTVVLVFELESAVSGAPPPAVDWRDLVLSSVDPDFAGALPWTTSAERALAPWLWNHGREAHTPGKRRLLVIGMDGARWDLMEPLLEAGELPTLAALRRRGRWGVLESTVPPESAIAWTAIATGVSPGRSGVHTFFSPDAPRRAFWHLLSDHGRSSLIVAVPKASPQRAFDGVLIGGWTLDARRDFTWPRDLKPHLLRAGYRPELFDVRNVDYYREHMQRRTAVARELLANIDWDLAFVVYEYTDMVGHGFGLESDAWREVYRAVDGEIAALLETTDEHTTVLLISDHGWKRYPRAFHLDAWLEGEGYTEWRANLPFSGSAIGISRQGERPGAPPGALRPGDAETLARMRAGLEALVVPGSDEKLVVRVRDPREAFPGPYAEHAPGRLFVELRDDFHVVKGGRDGPVFVPGPIDHHAREGLYLLAGPGIEPGEGPRRSVFDVAPTVLRHFGVAAPADAEGEALYGFGRRDAELATTGALYFGDAPAPDEATGPAETRRLEEQMRALGYIE